MIGTVACDEVEEGSSSDGMGWGGRQSQVRFPPGRNMQEMDVKTQARRRCRAERHGESMASPGTRNRNRVVTIQARGPGWETRETPMMHRTLGARHCQCQC